MGVSAGKREVPVSPWPWRGFVAAVAFVVVNALSAFTFGLVAAFAGSDRFGNAAMVCAVTAFVVGTGLGMIVDNGVPRRGLPREERVRLDRARARVRVDEEIRRLEREVEL